MGNPWLDIPELLFWGRGGEEEEDEEKQQLVPCVALLNTPAEPVM